MKSERGLFIRSGLYRATDNHVAGEDATMLASMCKLKCGRLLREVNNSFLIFLYKSSFELHQDLYTIYSGKRYIGSVCFLMQIFCRWLTLAYNSGVGWDSPMTFWSADTTGGDLGYSGCKYCFYLLHFVREGFKTPSHGKSPLGGYPPPPPGPQRTRFFCKVSEKNLTEKGGTPPPPLTDPKSKNFSPQAVFFGVFHPKNTVFGPKSLWKKVNGKGGYPLPPLNGRLVPKNRTEKVNGKGGYPLPPLTDFFL